MSDPDLSDRVEAALFPFTVRRVRELEESGHRLVHYTSADVAYSIISKREIWMRNAQTMNDYSEIAYGMSCIDAAAGNGSLQELGGAMDRLIPGTFRRAMEQFHGWRAALQHNTFLTCVSEHLGEEDDEDNLGRLSMWRAYGGENGVALILNPGFLNNSDMGNVHTSPVCYTTQAGFCEEVREVTRNVATQAEALRALGNGLAENFFQILRFALLCTKHPGFREEREWRVIYTPHLGRSPYIDEMTEVVRGVPQIVQKIQLANVPEAGVNGIAPADLIEAVLIGPTQFPMTLTETFFKAFVDLGVDDPTTRIRHSNIPLRR